MWAHVCGCPPGTRVQQAGYTRGHGRPAVKLRKVAGAATGNNFFLHTFMHKRKHRAKKEKQTLKKIASPAFNVPAAREWRHERQRRKQAAPVTTACIWTTWTNGGSPHPKVPKYE